MSTIPTFFSHRMNGYKMFDLVGRQGCGTRSSNVEVTMDPKMGNEKSGLGVHKRVRLSKLSHPGDRSHRREGHPT